MSVKRPPHTGARFIYSDVKKRRGLTVVYGSMDLSKTKGRLHLANFQINIDQGKARRDISAYIDWLVEHKETLIAMAREVTPKRKGKRRA